MDCVILFRVNGGHVQAVMDNTEIREFPNLDAAVSHTQGGTMFAKLIESGQADFQIVELNEL